MRSLEPGEDWYWCFEDEVAFRISGVIVTGRGAALA